MTGRFAQLTYTSYDNGGRGGWQVKDVVGELSATERDTLVNRVVTTFDLDPRLPEFPSGADLAARPARLARERLPDGTVAMWHTVEAGRDGSGRPGNVFAHVVLDRGSPEPGEPRPISLWGSDGWLRPYGPDQVVTASLPSSVPSANPAVSASSAIDFVIATMERQATFRVVMDAVLARLDGGPAVVLRVHDHEEAVAWISAVSHFLPRSAAHRLSWSTHDRFDRAQLDVANGLDVIAVPLTEALDSGIPNAVIISPDSSAGLALPGGRHTLSDGGTIAATAVSSLLEGILFDPTIAADVLERLDDVGDRFRAESPAASWVVGVAFSMTLAEMNDPDMVEFARDAQRLVVADFPPSAMDDPHTGPLISAALSRHPVSAQACLRLLQHAADTGRPTADLATKYLTTAITDGSWRTAPLGSIPRVHSVDLAAIRPHLAAFVSGLGGEAPADPGRMTASILIFAETVRRLVREDQLGDLLTELRPASPQLSMAAFDPGQWPQSIAFTDVNSVVYAALIRPRLATSVPSVIRTVAAGFWQLFGVPIPGANRPLLPPNPTDDDRVVLPYAALTFLSAPNLVGPDPVRHEVAREAIDAIIAAPTRNVSDEESRLLTGDILSVVPAVRVDIPHWVAQAPTRISGDSLHHAVLTGPADVTTLAALADPAQAHALGALQAAARLRLIMSDPIAALPGRGEYLELVEATVSLVPASGMVFAPEVADYLDAALIVARSYGERWAAADSPASRATYQQNAGRDDNVARRIVRLVHGHVITPEWTAGVAFLGETEAQRSGRPVDGDATIARIAMHKLRMTYPGPRSLDELRDACWSRLVYRSATEAERFFETYRKPGTAWLRANIPESDVQQRRLNPF